MIPAYTIGALDAEEKAEFERWLSSDSEGQRELATYQVLADTLVLITPARPAPAHLNADLKARLAARRSPTDPVQAPPPIHIEPPQAHLSSPDLKVIARGLRLQQHWFAAAAVFAALLAGIILWNIQRAPSDMGAQMYAEIASRPDMVEVALMPDEGHEEMTGKLVASADGMEAVIAVESLPNLAEDQTFQLWLMKNGQLSSGGLFRKTGDMTYIMLPLDAPVQEYDAFGVSIEPEGGSPMPDSPSGPRLFAVPMKA